MGRNTQARAVLTIQIVGLALASYILRLALIFNLVATRHLLPASFNHQHTSHQSAWLAQLVNAPTQVHVQSCL